MIDLKKSIRIIPIFLINPRAEKENVVRMGEELESLIATFGGVIVDRVIQKLDKPDHTTYIGKGKVSEVMEKVKERAADVVVLNAMAKPGQVHALKKNFQKVNPKIEVWDRVDLILHIFEKHAKTTEAKLQIQLARMKYMGPRIYGMGYIMSRQGGGIGTSGVGETNTELMKRHWRSEVKKVGDQLEKISKNKKDQLEQRKRSGFKTVSIVGYTNAGKSSLFNALCGKDVLVEDVLFATLDNSVGKFYSPELKKEILLTDTIGFIRNLPPRLIQAFNATLTESLHSDLLLHVIDIADAESDYKIRVVNEILHDLGRDTKDAIYVFNKSDLVPEISESDLLQRYEAFSPLLVSVKTGKGIADLQKLIGRRLQVLEAK